MLFSELGLKAEIQRAVADQGYDTPTPIQQQAIPAVLAYNRFSHDIDRLATRYESFMEEFSNILQRQTR